eukprot:CAMPEP_0169431364 /NCGR_PEP_ID=MMETSP1042-20121227/2906_1 /TAXON_ID=464988 /ORGANISM="Hemiselmis andersenii, Strain CCMP1180" /LENGTH=158 /DNA_ID=CAMNT_0009541767 /DNA_START=169 /DNA_END=645 /DNA_ORIENTATION=+
MKGAPKNSTSAPRTPVSSDSSRAAAYKVPSPSSTEPPGSDHSPMEGALARLIRSHSRPSLPSLHPTTDTATRGLLGYVVPSEGSCILIVPDAPSANAPKGCATAGAACREALSRPNRCLTTCCPLSRRLAVKPPCGRDGPVRALLGAPTSTPKAPFAS